MDARFLQLLMEYEQRIDNKLRQLREDTKEDTKVALTIALQPISSKLENIENRLQTGNEAFDSIDDRLKDHSDRIDASKSAHERCQATRRMISDTTITALEAKKNREPRGGWISAGQLPAIIAAVGSAIAAVLASVALARAPTPVASTPAAGTHATSTP
jgi:chromosome segregation ATPase